MDINDMLDDILDDINIDEGIYIPDFTTKRVFKKFVKDKIITEDMWQEMDDSMPPGTDLLHELSKLDVTHQPYVRTLLRNKKMKTITDDNTKR